MTKHIMGIDPGTVQSAYVMWDGKQILEKGIVPNLDMLSICAKAEPTCRMAYEFIQSFGMAVGKEVFETVFWVGRFYQGFIRSEKPKPIRVYRKDVKLYFCGTFRAKDTNIRQAILDRFGGNRESAIGTKNNPKVLYGVKSHLWSALAVAIYAFDNELEK